MDGLITQASNAVEFHNAWKVYRHGIWPRRRSVQALRGITFAVPSGSLFGLLGPNRAGKTTAIKALLTICRLTKGSVLRLGRPADVRSTLSRVGYVHENQAFAPYLSADSLLDYYGALSGVTRANRRQRIPQLLDEVGLGDRTREPIAGFSKGMLQRLSLAQALLADPDLLVLDEPTEGMDLVARHSLHELLRRRQRRGKTALLVSHSLDDVEALCDRVAVLRYGEVAFCGPLDELIGAGEAPEHDRLETALEDLYAGAAP
ncbi:MAG TPA: ABC transporter ATP-binding protein [Pirellulales bacterium]|nr:ABC transporter ATP-binding protein [Pirellulales bacterium]